MEQRALSLRAGGRPRWHDDRRRRARRVRARCVPARRRGGRSRSRARYGLHAESRQGAEGRRRTRDRKPAVAREGQRQSLCRPAERCDRKGCASGRARRLSLRRARQALHHVGMATDQGKTANVTALAILAEARGQSVPKSEPHDIARHMCRSLSARWVAMRAARISVLRASRPRTVGQNGKARCSSRRAPGIARSITRAMARRLARDRHPVVLAVRGGVGFCDVSTLGRSMCRARTPVPSSIASTSIRSRRWRFGKARYGLMLREERLCAG